MKLIMVEGETDHGLHVVSAKTKQISPEIVHG